MPMPLYQLIDLGKHRNIYTVFNSYKFVGINIINIIFIIKCNISNTILVLVVHYTFLKHFSQLKNNITNKRFF